MAQTLTATIRWSTIVSATKLPEAPWSAPDMRLIGTQRSPAPKFPDSLFGSVWSPWLVQQAEARGCPVDYVAAGLLGVAAGSIGNARRASPTGSWLEPTVLWIAAVGDPSAGKTQGLKVALDIARRFDSERLGELRRQQADNAARKETAEAHLGVWRESVKKAVRDGHEPPPKPMEASLPAPRLGPRILLNDTTVEKLARVSAHSPKGLIVERDELAGWVESFTRYSGSTDRPFWIEAYNGGRHTVDRVLETETIVTERLAIGIIGSLQPERLNLITRGDDDGLACRFLYFWPDAKPTFRIGSHCEDPLALTALARLRDLQLDDAREGPCPRPVPLDADALAVLEEFGQRMHERGATAIGQMAGFMGKAAGTALRLAVVLSYLRWAAGDAGAPEPNVIGGDVLKDACRLVESYFLPQAERAFGEASIPAADRNAKILAAAIWKDECERFNAREMSRSICGPLRDSTAMAKACDALVEAGWIRLLPHGGTKRKDYEVNPRLFTPG